MDEDRISRCRLKDGAVSASYLMEPTEGGVRRFSLSVVPGIGAGPPRILFFRLDDGRTESGRAVLLPWGATRAPPIPWVAHSMNVDLEEARLLCRFLDAELRGLVMPSPDPRDRSVEGDYEPVTETDKVPKPKS